MYIRLYAILSLLCASQATTAAFGPTAPVVSFSVRSTTTALSHHHHKHHQQNNIDDDGSSGIVGNSNKKKNGIAAFASNLAVAGTIFATSLAGASVVVAPPAPVNAATPVELSTGAITIQTSSQQGQSLLRTEVDAKALFGTLFKNRKALTSSVNHIVDVVKEEFSTTAWVEVKKEILQIEGDVAPEIKVIPPNDWQQTIKDVGKGKLNVIVNGEIINLSIDDTFSDTEDEIVIRAKGVKGVALPTIAESPQEVAKSALQTNIDTFVDFWYSPLVVPGTGGTTITNGDALLGGTVLFIVASYAASYSYYTNQMAEAEAQAAEKRKLAAERKAKAAAAKAKEEEGK